MTWDSPYAGGSADDFSPDKNAGVKPGDPPDRSKDADAKRDSTLPTAEIKTAIEAEFPANPGKVVPSINATGDVGSFVSEYMAYHVAWYQAYSQVKYADDAAKKCQKAGHTHVGIKVEVADAEKAVDIQLLELFKVLT